jgi:homoserine dehydrogenase
VVGSGTVQLLEEQRRDVEARIGARLNIKWICSRSKKNSPLLPKGVRQTKNWRDVVFDPQVDLVIELMGGTSPAREAVVTALERGKHVVTANKAILAKHWDDIFNLARKKRKLVYFEAAVGGAVPIVQTINEGLAGNIIPRIVGILNGTTNFILTRMQEAGESYARALAAAQKAGFAEADPTFDVDGIDAAQKIAILGSLATGHWINPENVYTEGISKLKTTDIRIVKELLHQTIKLLAIAELTPKGWVFRVHPSLVSQLHPFANVRNEYNAISVFGNAARDVMLYGKGAGKLPTSSAVVSDIIYLCRQIANGTAGQIPFVIPGSDEPPTLQSIESIESRYYLRALTQDKPGVLSRITGILGKHSVSIASVHQDEDDSARGKTVSIVLVTHKSSEKNVRAAVRQINNLSTTKTATVVLRME